MKIVPIDNLKMKKLVVILDPAHGENVPGKCSPDKKHFEWKWSRGFCKLLEAKLLSLGYTVLYTNQSTLEIGLTNRKLKAESFKFQNKFLISPHNNAARNDGQWSAASGVEIWTTPGQTKSDKYAEIIFKQLKKDFPSFKFRTDTADGDSDKEEQFTVLTGKDYAAVLIEWLFQDNKEDVARLDNAETNDTLCKSLVSAIEEINSLL